MCTPSGQRWLTAALDPFHDTNLELAGLPDMNGSPSLVMMYKQTTVVTNPGNSTTPWNCMVSIPGIQSIPYSTYYSLQSNNGSTFDVSHQGFTQNYVNNYASSFLGGVGPVTVFANSTASVAGDLTDWMARSGNSALYSATALGESTTTPCRVIGIAFEVYDVTPVLYQQGSVTVYTNAHSLTQHARLSFAASGGGATSEVVGDIRASPANDLPSAQLTCGARTWDAREGCYVVGRLADYGECRPQAYQAGSTSYIGSNDQAGSPNQSQVIWSMPGGCKGFHGFAPSGAIFTGLNAQYGALRVTARIMYEYFPRATSTGVTDPLLPLCTPSAPYDPQAFMEYAVAISKLPPGVPVKMNAAGDWFKMILKTVAASKIPHALNPMLGMAVDAMNRYVNTDTSAKPNQTSKAILDDNVKRTSGTPRRKVKSARRPAVPQRRQRRRRRN